MLARCFISCVLWLLCLADIRAQFTEIPNFGSASCHLLDADTVWIGSDEGIIKMNRSGTILSRWDNTEINITNIKPLQFAKDNQGQLLVYYNTGGIRRLEAGLWVTVTDILTPKIGLLSFKNVLVDAQNRICLIGDVFYRQNGTDWDSIPVSFGATTNVKAKKGPNGNIYVSNETAIAEFDGTNWTSSASILSNKLLNFDFTFAPNGDLFATFYSPGSNIPEVWKFPEGDFSNIPILYATAPAFGYKLTEPNRILYATGIAIDAADRVLLNLNGPTYHFIRWNGSTWTAFGGNANSPFLNYGFQFSDLTADSDGSIWMSNYTQPQGLYRFLDAIGFQPYNHSLSSMGWAGAVAPDGKVWFCGTGFIGHYDPVAGQFYQFAPGAQNTVFQDVAIAPQNGRVYTGSSKGIHQYDGQNWSLFKPLPQPNAQSVQELAVAADGRVWAAVKVSNTSYLFWGSDPNGGSALTFPFTSRINDLEAAPDSSVWGAVGNQIFRFKNGSFTYYNATTVGYPFNVVGATVTEIERDAAGRIWAFVDNAGLLRLENGVFTVFNTQNSDIYANQSCQALESDANGRVWLSFFESAFSGLHVFQNFDGTEWNTVSNLQSSLNYFGVTAIVAAPDGRMWFNDDFHLFYYQDLPRWLRGTAQRDANANCQPEMGEAALPAWLVRAKNTADGSKFYAKTAPDGYYQINLDSAVYTVELLRPAPLWEVCDGTATVDLVQNVADTLDFSGEATADCPLLELNVGVPFLRRCYENTYQVSWCNIGTSDADSAQVELTVPGQLALQSMSLPYISTAPGHYVVQLGAVPAGDCGNFNMKVIVDCDAELGSSLCVSAHILPDTICAQVPGWSGADLHAEARCTPDTVFFKIENRGYAPMSQQLEYIVIEDEVIMRQGPVQLPARDSLIVPFPVTSGYQRIQLPQEPGHPYFGLVSASTEGCNGQSSNGLTVQFPFNDPSPFYERTCAEVVGSFDPNDKIGLPQGIDDEHFILPGTTIDYKIRFQNTGTDTAFLVVLLDTLSAWLDPASIRVGGASHPFTWDISGQGVLRFQFKNILLPDSSTNQAASNGFLTFSIRPFDSIPMGTMVENRAAIYFDFNAPVMTNTTFHTVDTGFLVKNISIHQQTVGIEPSVTVFPNPADEVVYIWLRHFDSWASIRLYDVLGNLVFKKKQMGNRLDIRRNGLPEGVYFVEIKDSNGRLLRGKIIFNP